MFWSYVMQSRILTGILIIIPVILFLLSTFDKRDEKKEILELELVDTSDSETDMVGIRKKGVLFRRKLYAVAIVFIILCLLKECFFWHF
ncbi:MAG: hypothetical protein WC827_00260 [Candidatus Paceibacterota bacterium]|jgi:hypothetical protein